MKIMMERDEINRILANYRPGRICVTEISAGNGVRFTVAPVLLPDVTFSLKPGLTSFDGCDQVLLFLENVGCRSGWLPDLLARAGNALAKAFKQDIAAQLENLAPGLITAKSGSLLTVDVKKYAESKKWRLTPQHLTIEVDSDRLMVSCELAWRNS